MRVTLADYQLLERLYEGNKFDVYRALQLATQEKVIVKALRAEYPPLDDVVRCRREYEIARLLDSDGVVRPLALEQTQNGVAIILEDIGGVSLSQHLASHQMDLRQFLEVSITLADTLGHLHQKTIIHQDIKPHNIIVNMERSQVKLTDFGIASLLQSERQELLNPSQLEGTLSYMSPEQTGRMNRRIDYRTDFYSFGVTMYEMLTGQLPYPTHDPVELIHSHIAKRALPPEHLMIGVPQAVSDIVMRCLAKDAEDRYQSAYGLKHDLEACLRMLVEVGAVGLLEIGLSDKSEIFQIPERLYGREADLSLLLAAFDRVSQGMAEVLFVSGYSGIGKSFLVQEIHKPVVRDRGFFISGKFDQFKRHIPYHALIQAFRQLILGLLTESEEGIARWRKRLLKALDRSGQVMIDVFPELELIIGPQPAVQPLPPTEAQNRFQLVLQNFLNVFMKKEHPLVLFLDDLQWADSASLALLEFVMANPNTSSLLLIGAYRDQGMHPSDRLMLTIEEMVKKRVRIGFLTLNTLEKDHVTQLIADTMQCDIERVDPLSDLLMRKTNGNPFFVKQFLHSLHEQELICFDFERGGWQWDLEQIQKTDITDNVVEFMLAKVKMLPRNTQDMLKTAACIGHTFDLHTLAESVGRTPREAASELWDALQEGLLLPVGTAYKLLYGGAEQNGFSDMPEEYNVAFKFLHDRVQQVAYSMIPPNVRRELHLKIGQLMLHRSRREEWQEDSLFDMVNHLNEGRDLLSAQERAELVQLNLQAGKRAKASTAYEPALNYLTIGVELLEPDCWMSQYDLTFALYLERSQVEYLCGRFDTAEEFFELLLANAKTVLEKANVYNIKMVLYINQGRFDEVVKIGVEGVKLLGIKLPETSSRFAIFREIVKARWRLRKPDPQKLLELPVVTDPHRMEAMKLLLNISGGSYFSDQNLFFLLNLIALNLSLKHGNSVVSGLGYGSYGILLGSGFGDYKRGAAFGKLAIELDERFNVDILKSKGYFGFGAFINHWQDHIATSIDYLRTGYQRAIDAGDLLYAVYSIVSAINAMIIRGESLDVIHKEMQTYLGLVKRMQVKDSTNILLLLKGTVSYLRRPSQGEGIVSLSDDDFDEQYYLREVFETETPHTHGWYYINRMRVVYLLGHYAEALDLAFQAERVIKHSLGQPHVPEHVFYFSLALAANHPQRAHVKQIEKNLKKLRKWSKNCPANFLHKALLVQAELARINGRDQQAMELYDQAIQSAKEEGFQQNAAIANECAARFYLEKGREKIARVYLAEARYGYVKWGADAKVQQLDQNYPHLLTAQTVEGEARLEVASLKSISLMRTTETSEHNIDLLSVIKASRAISGEIVLSKVLETMIQIVVENAGAESGVLLIQRDDELWIEAQRRADNGVRVLQAEPLLESSPLSVQIVQYVKRTKEPVVLHDATAESMFALDPYIAEHRPKSILCMPFLNQGRSVGVLYLENNLATHAFTADRLEIMRLLSAQIAVSIENAKLYNQQLELNRAYGRFVPHQFLRFLQKNSITDVKLGDSVQTEMTVLFTDIRNFTTLSEQMTPKETFEFLNTFLSQMEPLVIENHGFIDKYIGDSIMSLFDKEADDAVRAGLAMLNKLREINAARLQRNRQPLGIGIGINSGMLMLGTLGGNNRMDSTVISDAVNVASRLEGLTKVYGTSLLISEHTYRRLKDPSRYSIRLIDHVKVRGKTEAISVYEVFDADPEDVRAGKLQTKPLFEEAFARLQIGDAERARELFAECLRVNPQDTMAHKYIEQLEPIK